MRFLVLVLTAATLSGCHTFQAAEPGVPTRGTVVRTYLEPAVPVSIGEVAVQQTVSVSGEVVAWEPDYLVLSAGTLVSASGLDYFGGGQTVRLPRSVIDRLEARSLSTWRTAALTGAVIAGAVFLGIIAQEGFGGEGGENGGGQTK